MCDANAMCEGWQICGGVSEPMHCKAAANATITSVKMQPLVDGRSRGLFWSRPMCAAEWALLAQYFGELSDPLWHRMRVHLRRLGDTRRALSFNGGFLSFPRYCFEGGDPRQPLRLDQPMICGWLMHEAFHHWQRLQGRAVTRDALRLQWRFWRHGDDPYQYALCESPEALLTRFQQAQVEQQAQMWQDAVMADRACREVGENHPQFAALQCAAQPWQAVLQWVPAQAGAAGALVV